ncbi:hypothetical protein HRR83_000596 [Exophiala dermatitidis]|nr:hypothetical protein HRR74_000598 [Exophiala dermatitidis]KAJ4528478.1 hypothetical protein HRR73_001101 [Exophiala dermatitidis]KAJ4529845.1 hypothetical protein HRR76_009097 [Exophiala dermatitidis]KAJ4558604.1 hypothetical protein HRR77_000596 [Exophiala dermatitidis]KAJ4581362.1 hypothetical protein HRR79_000400 [Exophiala dermatitidis]
MQDSRARRVDLRQLQSMAASIYAFRSPSPTGRDNQRKGLLFDFHYRIRWAAQKMRTKSFVAKLAPTSGFSKTVHPSRFLAYMGSDSRQVRGLPSSSTYLSISG